MKKLTPKQERFVQEYLIDLNATQAAIRAGYSAKTANEQGARLLANVSLQVALQEGMAKRSQATEWSAEMILRDIKQIAEDKGNEVKDRLKAYELGGKHLGMWKEKIDATVTGETTLRVVFDSAMGDD